MMIVTLTEMGEKKYVVEVVRRGRRRRGVLTAGLREALQERGRRLWETGRFGQGKCGEQAQWEVTRRQGDKETRGGMR